MTKHDCLGEFEKAQEDWESYFERLKHCFTTNDVVTLEKKRAILLCLWSNNLSSSEEDLGS